MDYRLNNLKIRFLEHTLISGFILALLFIFNASFSEYIAFLTVMFGIVFIAYFLPLYNTIELKVKNKGEIKESFFIYLILILVMMGLSYFIDGKVNTALIVLITIISASQDIFSRIKKKM